MKKALMCFLVVCFTSASAMAATITFDDPLPTDVTIKYFDLDLADSPVTALPTTNDAALQYTSSAIPGGGNALLTWHDPNFPSYGVLFTFDALQSHVSMVGNDFGGDTVQDNEVVFLSAFDISMNLLGTTSFSSTYDMPNLKPISIDFSDMKYVAFTWNTDLGYYAIDNVEYSPSTAVPEPSSMILLGCGLFGLVGFSRKKMLS